MEVNSLVSAAISCFMSASSFFSLSQDAGINFLSINSSRKSGRWLSTAKQYSFKESMGVGVQLFYAHIICGRSIYFRTVEFWFTAFIFLTVFCSSCPSEVYSWYALMPVRCDQKNKV